MPIYISLAKISEYESLDEKMFRIHLYTNIVQTAVNFILENIEAIHKTDKNLFVKLLNYFFMFDDDIQYYSMEEILLSVQNLIGTLNDELLSGNIDVVSEGLSEIDAQAGIEQFKVNGKLSEKEQLGFTINKLSHLNGARYIVEFFRELRQILSLKYSLLLIDEISGVSDKAQIEVFRLLRLIRGATESESQLTDEDFNYLENKIIPKLNQRNTGAETRNESRTEDKKLPVHLFLSVSRTDRKKLSNLIYRGIIHNLNRTRKPRTISANNEETKGLMLMLDLAVAFNYRVFNVQNAINYFQEDLRENAKRGYLYYSDISL